MPTIDLKTLIEAIQLGIAAAKNIAPVVKAAKDFITSLLESGAITIDQQAAAHAHMDAVMNAWLNNTPPPAWTVEADPA